jgi:hypothetical protein
MKTLSKTIKQEIINKLSDLPDDIINSNTHLNNQIVFNLNKLRYDPNKQEIIELKYSILELKERKDKIKNLIYNLRNNFTYEVLTNPMLSREIVDYYGYEYTGLTQITDQEYNYIITSIKDKSVLKTKYNINE